MGDEGKAISDALAFWKQFNLRQKSNEIDSQILKIYDKEQASTENRKNLAKVTKELGSLSEKAKLKAIRPVIRAYQMEIDQLTQRATFSENALIGIYKGLCDAPDPTAHLDAAVKNLGKLRKFEVRSTQNLSSSLGPISASNYNLSHRKRLQGFARSFIVMRKNSRA
eukprot:1392249-Amorphochlora_amoeboformis.AAC.2